MPVDNEFEIQEALGTTETFVCDIAYYDSPGIIKKVCTIYLKSYGMNAHLVAQARKFLNENGFRGKLLDEVIILNTYE